MKHRARDERHIAALVRDQAVGPARTDDILWQNDNGQVASNRLAAQIFAGLASDVVHVRGGVYRHLPIPTTGVGYVPGAASLPGATASGGTAGVRTAAASPAESTSTE